MGRIIEFVGLMNGIGVLATFVAYRWAKAKRHAEKLLRIEQEEKEEHANEDQARPKTEEERGLRGMR